MQDQDTATTVAGFEPGDVIRTPTGKYDGVVLRVVHATPPEKAARMIERTNQAGSGPLPIKCDYVVYRVLRDGKPYGPERTAAPAALTLVGPSEPTTDEPTVSLEEALAPYDEKRAARKAGWLAALGATSTPMDTRDWGVRR